MTGPSPDVRTLVLMRDMMQCQRCGADCRDGRGEVHHRCPRRMGGSSDTRINALPNLVLLCNDCHRTVESRRSVAYAEGWLLHTVGEATRVPIQGRFPPQRLTEEGRRILCTIAEMRHFDRTGSLPVLD